MLKTLKDNFMWYVVILGLLLIVSVYVLIAAYIIPLTETSSAFRKFSTGLAIGFILFLCIVGVITLMYKAEGFRMKKYDDTNFYQEIKEPLYRKMPIPNGK